MAAASAHSGTAAPGVRDSVHGDSGVAPSPPAQLTTRDGSEPVTAAFALGVDLGTTNTVAFLVHRPTGTVLPLELGVDPLLPPTVDAEASGTADAGAGAASAALLPSAVTVLPSGSSAMDSALPSSVQVLVGAPALAHPGAIVESKRLIGRTLEDAAAAAAAAAASAREGAPPVRGAGRGTPHQGALRGDLPPGTPLYCVSPSAAYTPQDVAAALLSRVAAVAAAAIVRYASKGEGGGPQAASPAAACGHEELLAAAGAPAATLAAHCHAVRVTVPAYFTDGPRRATLSAAAAAGLPRVTLVNEPTAAAVAYGATVRRAPARAGDVLVVDMGGGTYDVTALRVQPDGAVAVAASAGVAHLGGMDLDTALCAAVAASAGTPALAHSAALRRAVHRAKCALSFTEVPQAVPLPGGAAGASVTLHRRDVDAAAAPLVARALEVAMAVADEAATLGGHATAAGAVRDVLCVGGSTRLPALRAALSAAWPAARLCLDENPDTIVALGAALLAAAAAPTAAAAAPGGARVGAGPPSHTPLLRDITPLNIGVKSAVGTMQVLLPRGTPLGVAATVSLPTFSDYQRTQTLQVYEGQAPRAADNALLGTVRLSGMQRAAAGTVCSAVTAHMDASGVLHLHAEAPGQVLGRAVTASAAIARPAAPEHAAALAGATLRSAGTVDAAWAAARALHTLQHAALQALQDAAALVEPRPGLVGAITAAAHDALAWLTRHAEDASASAAEAALGTLLEAVRPALAAHMEDVARATEEGESAPGGSGFGPDAGAGASASTPSASGFLLHDDYVAQQAREGNVLRSRSGAVAPRAAEVAAALAGAAASPSLPPAEVTAAPCEPVAALAGLCAAAAAAEDAAVEPPLEKRRRV